MASGSSTANLPPLYRPNRTGTQAGRGRIQRGCPPKNGAASQDFSIDRRSLMDPRPASCAGKHRARRSAALTRAAIERRQLPVPGAGRGRRPAVRKLASFNSNASSTCCACASLRLFLAASARRAHCAASSSSRSFATSPRSSSRNTAESWSRKSGEATDARLGRWVSVESRSGLECAKGSVEIFSAFESRARSSLPFAAPAGPGRTLRSGASRPSSPAIPTRLNRE